MKISVCSLFTLALIVVLSGCKKKENDETPVIQEGTGAIFVTVVFEGQPVSGAVVSTEPANGESTTDVSGNVLIEQVSEGIYHVFATHSQIGSGSRAVAVDPGDVGNVTVHLIAGAFEGPVVDIFWVAPQTAGVGDTVLVKALVFEADNEVEDLSFEWSTDVDGLVSDQGLDESGYAVLEHVFETVGQRTLTITVTNSEGESNSDQVPINIIELPDPVVLDPIETENYAPQLNWTPTDADNFNAYRVYRQGESDFTLIQAINDISTTSFTDFDIEPESDYNYRIGLFLNNGFEIMSNTVSWQFGGAYIDVEFGLDMIRHDPNNPMIYGIDTDNNSLVFIDTELEEVVNSFYVGSMPTDMDFSLDNQLLYIANFGSTQITVVDLATQSVQSTFFVDADIGTWGDNPHTLAVLANGLLAFSSNEYFSDIKLVDINNGNNVYTSSTTYRTPYLLANSDGTQLFVAESETNWCELRRFHVVNDELVLLESSNEYSSPERLAFITDNNEFVFYAGRKLLVNNLPSTMGSFNEAIYTINSDGSRVLGETKVFNGNDFSYLGDLPVSTTVSVFSNDDNYAYLFHEQSARLYKISVE